MKCEKCESNRILQLNAKSSNLNFVEVPHLDIERDGCVPNISFIGGGDYVELDVCLDCGHIQNFHQLNDEEIKDAFGIEEEDTFDDLLGDEIFDDDDFYE